MTQGEGGDLPREGAGWRELPPGGIILIPGGSERYTTGDWRTSRPVWHRERCIQCLLCWVYCPDGAIRTEDGKVVGVDLRYCKGCGICAAECPDKARAIEMVPEARARREGV